MPMLHLVPCLILQVRILPYSNRPVPRRLIDVGWLSVICYRPAHVRPMKQIPLTIIAAVLLVGCGEAQQQTVPDPTEVAEAATPELPATTATPAEAQPPQPVAEVPVQQPSPPAKAKPAEPATTDAKPESLTVKPSNPAADSALRDAAMKGNIESIKQHLDAGANVSAKDVNDWTPLYYAANNEIAELLITRGADVNAIDKRGWSPLHAAVMGGEETIEFLIANGANVNAKIESGSYKGMTPLDLASKAEIADLIRKHGGESGK